MPRARYSVAFVDDYDFLLIKEEYDPLHPTMSVTNDIEHVVLDVVRNNGDYPIIVMEDGMFCRIYHNAGTFESWGPDHLKLETLLWAFTNNI